MNRRRYIFAAGRILDLGAIDGLEPVALGHWSARMLCAEWRDAGIRALDAGSMRIAEFARARFLELHEALAAERSVRRAA